MKETKLATVETKIIKNIFGVEKYAIVDFSAEFCEDGDSILYYKPRIYSIHESKDDAIKCIQDNDSYGAFIVPMTQLLKKEHVQH